MILSERIAAARRQLRNARLSDAEAEFGARVLAEHALGWTTDRLLIDGNKPEPDGFAARYGALIARRATREPLPYIVGHREFWGLEFDVTPAVLIPRPETELIVEAVLALHPNRAEPLEIADIGTGTGCVAIAIALERPAAAIVATDISPAALAIARGNADTHGVSERIRFVEADLMSGIDGSFDVIAANPPYVRTGDVNGLQPEVRNEPVVALFAGPDGLDAIRRLIAGAPARLRSGGHLVFEFGFGQDVEIERLIEDAAELTLVTFRRDLQGIARTAVVRRHKIGRHERLPVLPHHQP